MGSGFDPGALLGRSYTLVDGPRVRLRMARSSDGAAIRRLLERACAGLADSEIADEVARLTQFDPRARNVLCATTLIGTSERLVGVGSVELAEGTPDTVVVDPVLGEPLAVLLDSALAGRASAVWGRRAA